MSETIADAAGRALWYVDPGRAELRDEPLGLPAPGMARVRASHGAISRGTEALVANGRIPRSEFQRMRAPFMAGMFPFPVKYGYSTVGVVEAGSADLRGRTVFTLHPHQTLFDVPGPPRFLFRGTSPRGGRCSRPIWKPRSTPSGMRVRGLLEGWLSWEQA